MNATNPFYNGDPFGTQSSYTADIASLKVIGNEKLLLVVFIVDCSRSMQGERIASVNAALQEVQYKLTELKTSQMLNLQISIMSFTSNAVWELTPTPVDEVPINPLETRAGLTDYGIAFKELNRKLRKDEFLKYEGKVASPAIIFLTDGEPTDDYTHYINDLLKNDCFCSSSRIAILLGDAINHPSARNAVVKFVEDPSTDIVTAEDAEEIVVRIKTATMHTVVGKPMINRNLESQVKLRPTVLDKTESVIMPSQNDREKKDISIEPFEPIDPADVFNDSQRNIPVFDNNNLDLDTNETQERKTAVVSDDNVLKMNEKKDLDIKTQNGSKTDPFAFAGGADKDLLTDISDNSSLTRSHSNESSNNNSDDNSDDPFSRYLADRNMFGISDKSNNFDINEDGLYDPFGDIF